MGLQPPPSEHKLTSRRYPNGVQQAELLDAGGQAVEVAQVCAERLADDDVLDPAALHECNL